MFTGIVSEMGEVEAVESGADGARLRIRAAAASELGEGDSIAVDGACLTATRAASGAFEAEVMNQTLELTTLGALRTGDRVNLELPLRPTDRFGGHVVQGHVDGSATVAALEPDGFARRLRLTISAELAPYVVERGSIAVQGVSLTVSVVGPDWVEASVIPETLERTTLGSLAAGDQVNVECDVMARYVRRSVESLAPSEEERKK